MNDKAAILAVDDSSDSLALLEAILTQADYDVCLVDNCEHALAAVAANPPDLILVDLHMIDMDGLEACRRLKAGEETRHIPIILIGAFTDEKEWVMGLQLGATDYITKPIRPEELLTRVRTHLALSRAGALLEAKTIGPRQTTTEQESGILERQHMEDTLRANLEHAERSRRAMLSILEDQKRSEAAMGESEQKLRLVTDNIQDMIWLMDLDMHATWVSPSVTRIRGYDKEELTAMTPDQHLTSASKERLKELMALHLTPERLADPKAEIRVRAELEIYKKDGSTFWEDIVVTLLRDENGKPTGFLSVGRDITGRKLAERAKEDSEKRYRRLFEAAKDGILILDADSGEIVDVNPFLIGLTGYSKNELMGKHLWEIGAFKDIQASRSSFEELRAKGYVRYEDLPLKSVGGKKIDVEFVSNTYEVDGHDVIQCNIRDISERKTAQDRDRLVRNALETLNRAGAGMDPIHDLLRLTQESLDIQAVGIRLKDGEDFPYYETIGFPEQFVQKERFLCARDEAGNILRDAHDIPELECLCGNVLRNRTDSMLPFFTAGGSFWSNCTTELPASTIDENRQPHLRNRCNREGYESVALVPLKSGGEITGLLQLNDRRRGRFTAELIAFLEGLGASIGIALLRKQAEAELRFRNILLSTQLEASIDGILVVDIDGKIISHNQHFVDMFGIPREVIESKSDVQTIRSVVDKTTNAEEFLNRIGQINANLRETSQDEIVLKDGTAIDRYSAPLLDSERKPFGRVWYFRDITARKQAEQVRSDLEAQLRGAQKMEAIGSLAGGVAHDFNNLLSVILSYTGFVLNAVNEGDPMREDLLEVKKAAERAAALTRQLLAFSRKQVLQPLPLDVNQIAAGVEKMLRRILGEDIDLVQVLAPDLGLTLADPGQIEQVFMNLVVNARDAMPEGGKLTIETRNVVLDDEYATLHEGTEPGPYVLLAVSDSGLGMDERTKARIFEPFFTTKQRGKGTGLGLSTVWGIVKQSGGSIWVYSELGQGSTFKIYLPRDLSATATAASVPATASTSPVKTGTILVVEDEEALRKVAKRTLDAAGYTVLTAADGDEALRTSARHEGEIGILLTDVVMPHMGGRLLAQELSKTRPTVKVIYMSGYTDNAIVHHGVLDVGTNFIGKPFTAEALLKKVDEVLGGDADLPAGWRDQADEVPDETKEQTIDRDALRSLPAESLSKLRAALVAARYDEIIELIAVIRATKPELAAELQRMAELFDFQVMKDLLD